MGNRKQLPDKLNKTDDVLNILQGVTLKPLQGEAETGKEEVPGAVESIKQYAVEQETEINPNNSSQKLTTAATQISKGVSSLSQTGKAEKTKVNLYLEADIKRRTEQAQIDLRRIVPQNKAGQINYSMIVETALEIVFDEFDRIGEASQLCREITQKLENK